VARSRQIATVTGDRFLFREFLKEWGFFFFSFLFYFFASSQHLAKKHSKKIRIFLFIKSDLSV
jgi:hypothetical protein